jgi:hypothetical protein
MQNAEGVIPPRGIPYQEKHGRRTMMNMQLPEI